MTNRTFSTGPNHSRDNLARQHTAAAPNPRQVCRTVQSHSVGTQFAPIRKRCGHLRRRPHNSSWRGANVFRTDDAARTGRQVGSLHVEPLEDRLLLASDMVLRWNEVLLEAIRVDRTAPPLAARDMAIVHVAIYDAVNAIEKTYEPYAVDPRGKNGAFARGGQCGGSPSGARGTIPGPAADIRPGTNGLVGDSPRRIVGEQRGGPRSLCGEAHPGDPQR